MPLERFINGRIKRIRNFVAAPTERLLLLLVEPEAEALLIKVVHATDEKDSGNIFLGFDEAFTTAETFYPAIAEQILNHCNGALPELKKRGVNLELPPAMPDGFLPVELRFASFIDQVAGALTPYCDHIVLIFFPKEVSSAEGLRSSLALLMGSLQSEAVKLIFSDHRSRPRLGELAESRRDVKRDEFYLAPEEIEDALKQKLADPGLPAIERMRVVTTLAGFDLSMRRFEDAYEKNVQVLAQARELNSRQDEAAALYNIGNTFYYRGNYPEARENYESSLEIALDNDLHGLAPQVLLNIGHTFLAEERAGDAVKHYEAAKAYSQGVGNLLGKGHALDCIGLAFHRGNDTVAAERAWHEAFAVYDSIGGAAAEMARYGKIQVLDRLKGLYAELGDGERAYACEVETQALSAGPKESLARAGSV
jgi:tetratricopeptide (TPR) repeat protein